MQTAGQMAVARLLSTVYDFKTPASRIRNPFPDQNCTRFDQMHEYLMPDWALERIVARQGAPLVHHRLPARETALVVVDLQIWFMEPGMPAEVPAARAIVPNVNRLAAALRAAGGTVVWIRTLYTDQALAEIPHFHRVLMRPERMQARSAALAETARPSLLWPELDVRPEDLVVGKTRYSAFIQGASDLDAVLKARGITAVAVAGTMTNVCCDSTARDAMMLNYRTTMVADANASLTAEEHCGALTNFALQFGDVTTTDEMVARWQAEAEAAA